MWKTKQFKTHDKMIEYIEKNNHKIQWVEIFINNGYRIEYRKLKIINFD